MRQLSFRALIPLEQTLTVLKCKLTEYKRNEQDIGVARLFTTQSRSEKMLYLEYYKINCRYDKSMVIDENERIFTLQ